MKTLLKLLFAATLFVAGCGGGSGGSGHNPQIAEKPSDIWQGVAYNDNGTEEAVVCVITPGLTVLCSKADGELDGKIVKLEGEETLRIEYKLMPEILPGPDGPVAGEGVIDCEWSPHGALDCDYAFLGEDGRVESGHMVLLHRDNHADEAHSRTCLLNRRINQAHVAGTWIDEGGPIPMLSIDRVGRAYGHNATTGCYFNGTVRQRANPALDPWRNLYDVALLIEGCEAPDYAVYNGRMLRGISFLDDGRLRNDTLQMLAAAKSPDGPAGFTADFRRQ